MDKNNISLFGIPFKKYKETGVTILGSSNIDLFLYVDEFPKDGETIHANELTRTPGGKGSNQAIMIANLSTNKAKNIFVGCVGDDGGGQRIKNNYKNHGFLDVDKHVRVVKNSSGHASVYVNKYGVNRIILDYGANSKVLKKHFDDSFDDIKKNTKIFVTQFELNMDIVEYGLKKCKEAGIYTILNPAPAKKNLAEDLCKSVDLIIPNETEAEVLLGGFSVKNLEDAKAACYKFREKGWKNVIITLGANGCVVLKENDKEVIHVGIQVKVEKVVDTTGAGDSFVGSLSYFLSCGEDMIQAIKYSCYLASLSVQVKGKGCQGSYPIVSKNREKLVFED